MKPNRLEAFSDGVIAIIITIMVLDLRVPHGPSVQLLFDQWPTLLSYALSFVIVGIYWVNHHHLILVASTVDRRALWANMNLLFWLSLIPFGTKYMGENHAIPISVAVYGTLLTACALAWWFLAHNATRHMRVDPEASTFLDRRNKKVGFSIALNTVAVAVAFVSTPVALALLVVPPILYFLPDKHDPDRLAFK